jgi:DNA-binding CsgD family transcriptional regulator
MNPHIDSSALAPLQSLASDSTLRQLLDGRKLLMGNPSPAYGWMLRTNLLRIGAGEPQPQLLAICYNLTDLTAALAGADDDTLLVTRGHLQDGCCVPLLLEVLDRPNPLQMLVVLGVEEPPLPLAPLLDKATVSLAWEGNIGKGVVIEAIAQLQRGGRFLDPDVRRLVEADLAIAGSLTVRERQVLALLAEGLTNRQIAERIVVANVTARDHVQRILHKLTVKDRTAAAVLALRLGLLD